jgi:purine nucleosidase
VTIPLIMDVDTGVDDAVALLLAVASPVAELLAVTCVAGNVPAPQAAANTLAVLELAGAGGVEVALGSVAPLVEPLRTAVSHGPTGLGYADLPAPAASLSPRFGPDLIVEEARRRPGELLLVATGPLTNVALALRREPELPRLLRGLAVMGGAFEYPGNATPAAEFNVLVDPEAASAAFAAFAAEDAARPLVCGLNVTERVGLEPPHLSRLAELAGGTGNELVHFLSDALQFKMEAHQAYGGRYIAHMHDPLALALALDRSLGETRPGTVDVELGGRLTRGMTVVDWSGARGRPVNADVALSVDAERFLDELVRQLAELARARP